MFFTTLSTYQPRGLQALKSSSPKAASVLLGLSLGLLINPLANAATAPTTPIYFAKNATQKTVVGSIPRGEERHFYRFKAFQGQYMTITLLPRRGFPEFANVGVVTSPSGQEEGGKGAIIYQGCLTESGSYRLRIARNLMATHGERAGYQIKMVILPRKQSQANCG